MPIIVGKISLSVVRPAIGEPVTSGVIPEIYRSGVEHRKNEFIIMHRPVDGHDILRGLNIGLYPRHYREVRTVLSGK